MSCSIPGLLFDGTSAGEFCLGLLPFPGRDGDEQLIDGKLVKKLSRREDIVLWAVFVREDLRQGCFGLPFPGQDRERGI